MGIKEILEKVRSKNGVYKEIKAQDDAVNKLEQRKLSAEERALDKIIEQRRQEKIKVELNKIHKQEDDEYWHKDIIKQKNLFREKPKLLNNPSLFSNQRNLFVNNRRLF